MTAHQDRKPTSFGLLQSSAFSTILVELSKHATDIPGSGASKLVDDRYTAVTGEPDSMAASASSAIALSSSKSNTGLVPRRAASLQSYFHRDTGPPRSEITQATRVLEAISQVYGWIHASQFVPGGPVPCLRSTEYMETGSTRSSLGPGPARCSFAGI
ncbi:uncharacterized protein LY79DRAFT_88922 [Colletotrichum navitas]|uniref:Uncharacterized protein n=1 Tax=Colletotrichum navitas TaxID=681940 RepID=A0AAD8Q4J4_9PEZI|nr:uncharacterized protein LY79DRAFT_88922 [Colletotrichum navitas]KAK1595710.1 hypothetical protein LY79DRAFT_88922 [Colletotrichum navitas]